LETAIRASSASVGRSQASSNPWRRPAHPSSRCADALACTTPVRPLGQAYRWRQDDDCPAWSRHAPLQHHRDREHIFPLRPKQIPQQNL